MPRKVKEPKAKAVKKEKAAQVDAGMNGNTKLQNNQGLRETYKNGVRIKASNKVILSVVDEDGYNTIFSPDFVKMLCARSFNKEHFGHFGFQLGETHEVTLAVRCQEDSSGDAPGQMKIGDEIEGGNDSHGDDGKIGDQD